MNMKLVALAAILTLAVACTKEETKQKVSAKSEVETAIDVAVPIGGRDDPAAREKERFDERWRELQVFRNVQARQHVATAQVNVTFMPNGKESFKGLDANAINNAPVVVPLKGDVAGPSVLKTQVYLDRLQFSVGALDGRWGRNTAIALWWYQRSRDVAATEGGALDEQTFRALAAEAGQAPALVEHTVTEEDVQGPFVTIPDDMYEKAELECLCYESPLEKLAEQFHTSPELLSRLNDGVDFGSLKAGGRIWVPNVRPPMTQDRHRARGGVDPRQHVQRLRRQRESRLPRADDTGIEIRSVAQRDGDGEEHHPRSVVPLPAHAFRRSPGRRAGGEPASRAELAGGRGVDRAQQAAFRDSRHVGPRLDRLRLIARMRAVDELGCGGIRAPDQAGRSR